MGGTLKHGTEEPVQEMRNDVKSGVNHLCNTVLQAAD